jgi:hypothetical protein
LIKYERPVVYAFYLLCISRIYATSGISIKTIEIGIAHIKHNFGREECREMGDCIGLSLSSMAKGQSHFVDTKNGTVPCMRARAREFQTVIIIPEIVMRSFFTQQETRR